MNLPLILACALGLSLLSPLASAQQTGAGNDAAGVCMVCHATTSDSEPMVGPHLSSIMGRSAASVVGFDYSDALEAKGATGFVWSRESLTEFLRKPNEFIPGIAMTYPGEPDEIRRSQIVDWLASLELAQGISAQTNSSESRDPRVEQILQISADPDYGEYLAGQCVTCHKAGDASGGVPSINGLTRLYTIQALLAYRDGVRPNTTMQQVTQSLGAEEIAALAKYFSSQ